MREGLGCKDIDSRLGGEGTVELAVARALAAPALQATVPDLEFAHTVLVLGCEPLDDAPILDLRIRKGVRRRGVQLAIASARPSALDVNARSVIRYAPGEEAAFVAALAGALTGGDDAQASGASKEVRGLAELLKSGGEDVVIVWGERLASAALPALLSIAETLGLAGRDGAGLLELPAGANGRGLREAGVLPNAGPGYAELETAGRSAAEIARAAADGEVTALYLFGVDPVRELPDRALWEQALHSAGLVVAHASVLTDGLREHANVIFPAESYAEKEGTLVHPDGRLQRLRTAIAHPDEVRSGWSVIAEVAKRAGFDMHVLTGGMAFAQLAEAVPFYKGITLEQIGGRGLRWPASEEHAAALPAAGSGERAAVPKSRTGSSDPDRPSDGASGTALRLGTYRPIWAAPEVEISPALHFAVVHQQLEISPEDATRLGIANGEAVSVGQNGTRLSARAAVRTGVPEGTAFLAEGIESQSANALTEPLVEVSKS